MTCRSITLFVMLLTLGLSGCMSAQSRPMTALPPPDINDPGVQSAPPTSIPALPSMHDPRGESRPTVKVRKQGGDTIEEYSHNGQLYMIRVIPAHGVPQTFIDTDGDGRLNPGDGNVAPVYYTLYQWD